MKKVTEEMTTQDEAILRVYEVAYLCVPTIAEEAMGEKYATLQALISKHASNVISEEAPYMRELSYEMIRVINNENKRFTDAYFGWIKFEATTSSMREIEKALKADQDIIRSMIVRTVRENTTYTKRPQKEDRGEEGVAEEAPVAHVKEDVVVEQTA